MFILISLLPISAASAEINHVEISDDNNHYRLTIKTTVNADVDDIKRIITDYNHLTAINPYLKLSEVVEVSENGRTTVNMLSEACVFIICYNIRHVQTFHAFNSNTLFARIIPKQSDFQSGWLRWFVKPVDSNDHSPRTEIIFDTEVTPGFFVPPLIGPYQIKRKMIEVATITINNLEKKAGNINTD